METKQILTGQIVDNPSPVVTDVTRSKPSLDLAMGCNSRSVDNPALIQIPVIKSLDNEMDLDDVSEHSVLMVVESSVHVVGGSEGNVVENETEICNDVDSEPGNIDDPGFVYYYYFLFCW